MYFVSAKKMGSPLVFYLSLYGVKYKNFNTPYYISVKITKINL